MCPPLVAIRGINGAACVHLYLLFEVSMGPHECPPLVTIQGITGAACAYLLRVSYDEMNFQTLPFSRRRNTTLFSFSKQFQL